VHQGVGKRCATRVDLALDKAFVIIDRQDPYRGMSLRLPLNAIPNRAYPIGKQRDVKSASNRLRFSGILYQGNNLGRWHAPHNRVHRSVTYHLAGVNNEDGWLGDAAFLAGVVDAPVPNDATFSIAQNRKRQREVNPQGLRFVGCIHRDSHYARARRPDFQVVLSVVRQLAEAERSPITAIEEQHQAAVRDQLRQPPRHSCRVSQFEFLCKFARDGNLCHRPRLTLRLDVPGYFDYTRLSLSVPRIGWGH
jgi:hypothetical protein